MKFSKYQKAYTVALWLLMVSGTVLIAGGEAIGWVIIVAGLAMGISRTISTYRLSMNAMKEKDGGEDEHNP